MSISFSLAGSLYPAKVSRGVVLVYLFTQAVSYTHLAEHKPGMERIVLIRSILMSIRIAPLAAPIPSPS